MNLVGVVVLHPGKLEFGKHVIRGGAVLVMIVGLVVL